MHASKFRRMTVEEIETALLLGRCHCAPYTFDSRFIRSLADVASLPKPRITERQAEILFRLADKYHGEMMARREVESRRDEE